MTYDASAKSKSELYVELLPLVNARRCELLDVPRLKTQLLTLERRVGRGTGRDSVDHQPGAHDDVANAAAGALVLAAGGKVGGKRYKLMFDASVLAAGNYFLVLQTPTGRVVQPMQVEH